MNECADPTVICILGMHRSGTSCLTGSLQTAGLSLGKHHTWNKFNQKGNRENQDIVDFHDALLADNRGAWDAPPRKTRFDQAHLDAAIRIIESFSNESHWGFKDPRALLALPLWQQLLPDMRPVGIFRHPLAVHASLNRRTTGGMSRDKALGLWYHYNRILLRVLKRREFPLMCFDWDEERFHSRLNQLVPELGLDPLDPEQRFYSQELRNFDASELRALPWRVKRLYRKLQDIADRQ